MNERSEKPGHRIDIRERIAHVTVRLGGELLAETRNPVLLDETGLPTRYYLAPKDVRMELLTPSEKRSTCPFKGEASYWSVRVGDDVAADLVWSYPDPIPEARKIAGLLCFYNEKVDLAVDGTTLERPATPYS